MKKILLAAAAFAAISCSSNSSTAHKNVTLPTIAQIEYSSPTPPPTYFEAKKSFDSLLNSELNAIGINPSRYGNFESLAPDEKILFLNQNFFRLKNNLPELLINNEVLDAALERAIYMGITKEFTHTPSKLDESYVAILDHKGIIGYRGENIAWMTYPSCAYDLSSIDRLIEGYMEGFDNIKYKCSSEIAFTAFVNSQGHRENILNANYSFTGVGMSSEPTHPGNTLLYYAVLFSN